MRIFSWQKAMLALVALSLVLPACNQSQPLPEGTRVDKIVVVKSAHTLTLMNDPEMIRTYKIAIGRNQVGAKTLSGDHKTPEGEYVIDAKKSASRFHLALHISYPNQIDRDRSQQIRVNPGGDIEIHGIENGLGWIGGLHRSVDWTDGCIAVTDEEIDEIWKVVAVGTPVEIRP
jgi:murein L,D-transpeptidase YafK